MKQEEIESYKKREKRLENDLSNAKSGNKSLRAAEKQIEELKAEVHSLRVRLASSEKKQDSSLPSG